MHWTQHRGHAFELAQAIAQQAEDIGDKACIIAIGGDGTIHEVVNGAAQYQSVYIGVVGAGSGNDFARGFSTFTHARDIEHFVLNPITDARDYGIVQHNQQKRVFVNNCGVGFDAFVGITANESRLKNRLNKVGLGQLSYVYYVVRTLMTFQTFEICILQNGQKKTYQNVWFATVSNQPYFGGGMNLSPTSKTDDGFLELTIVNQISKWKLLLIFGTVFFAKHTNFKEITQLSSEAFTLQFDADLLCHADGEKQLLGKGPQQLDFTVKKKAWHLAK